MKLARGELFVINRAWDRRLTLAENRDLLAGNAREIKTGIRFALDLEAFATVEHGQILAPAHERRSRVVAEENRPFRLDERDDGLQADWIVPRCFLRRKVAQLKRARERA